MGAVHKMLSAAKKVCFGVPGFHTKRQILVIESDDWGSIRMPSRAVLDELIAGGDHTDQNAFLANDCLESAEDLQNLYAVLSQFRDIHGNHPCITANFAVANPDFDRIVPEQGIYHFEPFPETYARYYGPENDMLQILQDGISRHLIKPQLHAREHMNVTRWMHDLSAGDPHVTTAFRSRMIDVNACFSPEREFGYMDALNYDSAEELACLYTVLSDAAALFEQIFGYRSKTFVASCFVWRRSIERILHELGIQTLQTGQFQHLCPGKGTRPLIKLPHYTGQKNRLGQFYTVRCTEYEPAYGRDIQKSIDVCMKQIRNEFRWGKPAIINSHRFNYIGSIHPKNARRSLNGLRRLLTQIQTEFPNVEFLSSDELADLMTQ